MPDHVELHFESTGRRLRRFILTTPSGRIVASDPALGGPSERPLRDLRGLRVLILALVRLALADRRRGAPLLEGGRSSAASTLDSLIQKAPTVHWLRDVLEESPTDSASRRLQDWFARQNANLNDRNRPVRIQPRFGPRALRPEAITVRIGAGLADSPALARLECQLAQNLGEPTATSVEFLGVLPCAGDGVIGRECELRALHDLVADGTSPGIQILGDSGVGKTALVARWLDELENAPHPPFRRIVVRAFGSRPVLSAAPAPDPNPHPHHDPRPTLLVLDALDRLPRDERDLLAATLPTSFGTFLLITSRLPLAHSALPTSCLHLGPRTEPSRQNNHEDILPFRRVALEVSPTPTPSA